MSDNRDDMIMAAPIRIEGKLDRIERRLDHHELLLVGIREDIGVNMHAARIAVDTVRHYREELSGLSGLVSGMTGQITRLQEDVRRLEAKGA